MADRGDVLRLKRRLGFAAKGETESVVVVQAAALNSVLSTLLVVPLDPPVGASANHPAVLRISRDEVSSPILETPRADPTKWERRGPYGCSIDPRHRGIEGRSTAA